MRRTVLFACALTLLASAGHAERKIVHGQPIQLRLGLGMTTFLMLPEPIEGVLTSVDPKRYSVEYRDHIFAIKVLDPNVRDQLLILGQSRKSYIVQYAVHEPADDLVYVLSEQQQPQLPTLAKALSMPDVMHALRTGTPLPGQKAVDLPAPLVSDPRIQLVGWQAVQTQQLIGLVMNLRNGTEAPLGLDIRYGVTEAVGMSEGVFRLSSVALPPGYTVLGISSDRERLAPGESLRVYWVMERR